MRNVRRIFKAKQSTGGPYPYPYLRGPKVPYCADYDIGHGTCILRRPLLIFQGEKKQDTGYGMVWYGT